MPTFPGKLAPGVPKLERRVKRQMRGNPRRRGKKLFLAIPHPRRERARTQGIMTKTGDTLVGGGKECPGPLQMSDLALGWGAQSDRGDQSRGSRLALPDSRKQGHLDEGGHRLLRSSCRGVGRQVDKGHGREAAGEGHTLKGAGPAPPLHLLGTPHLLECPAADLFMFPWKAKESSTEW